MRRDAALGSIDRRHKLTDGSPAVRCIKEQKHEPYTRWVAQHTKKTGVEFGIPDRDRGIIILCRAAYTVLCPVRQSLCNFIDLFHVCLLIFSMPTYVHVLIC